MPRLKDQWHFSGNGRAHGDGDLVHGDLVHGGLDHGGLAHGGRVHGGVAHVGGVRGGAAHGGVGQGGGVRGAALGDAVPDDAALDAGDDDAVPGDAGSDAEGYGLGEKVPALSEIREIVVYQTKHEHDIDWIFIWKSNREIEANDRYQANIVVRVFTRNFHCRGYASVNRVSIVQKMAWRWICAKLLFKPMLGHCQLDTWNKFQWSFNHGNASENIVCEMATILLRVRWVNTYRQVSNIRRTLISH